MCKQKKKKELNSAAFKVRRLLFAFIDGCCCCFTFARDKNVAKRHTKLLTRSSRENRARFSSRFCKLSAKRNNFCLSSCVFLFISINCATKHNNNNNFIKNENVTKLCLNEFQLNCNQFLF